MKLERCSRNHVDGDGLNPPTRRRLSASWLAGPASPRRASLRWDRSFSFQACGGSLGLGKLRGWRHAAEYTSDASGVDLPRHRRAAVLCCTRDKRCVLSLAETPPRPTAKATTPPILSKRAERSNNPPRFWPPLSPRIDGPRWLPLGGPTNTCFLGRSGDPEVPLGREPSRETDF